MKVNITLREGGFYVELYDRNELFDVEGPFESHDDAFFAAERAVEIGGSEPTP